MRCGVKIVSLSNGFTRGKRERERERESGEGGRERAREGKRQRREIFRKNAENSKYKSNFEPLQN